MISIVLIIPITVVKTHNNLRFHSPLPNPNCEWNYELDNGVELYIFKIL